MWLIFYFSYVLIIKSISLKSKILYFALSSIFLIGLQSTKVEFRKVILEYSSKKDKVLAFGDIFLKNTLSKVQIDEDGFYIEEEEKEESAIQSFITRLNLGWVVASIINHDKKMEFLHTGNKLFNDIPSILLPRFLYKKKKLVAGYYQKDEFYAYTGKYLPGFTTVNLSAFGDAYINFGKTGAIFCMFFFGILIRFILNQFFRISLSYPSFIFWMPLIFYDFIRMNDFYTNFNSLFKNSILLAFLFYVFKTKIFYKSINEAKT
jgi:hypothetical protein